MHVLHTAWWPSSRILKKEYSESHTSIKTGRATAWFNLPAVTLPLLKCSIQKLGIPKARWKLARTVTVLKGLEWNRCAGCAHGGACWRLFVGHDSDCSCRCLHQSTQLTPEVCECEIHRKRTHMKTQQKNIKTSQLLTTVTTRHRDNTETQKTKKPSYIKNWRYIKNTEEFTRTSWLPNWSAFLGLWL